MTQSWWKLSCLVLVVVSLAALAGCSGVAQAPPTPTPVPTPIPSVMSLDVAGGKQSRSLTCESQSASDLAKFWGKSVNEMEFFYYLPRSDNPFKGFVGSPDSPAGSLPPSGYGVYAPPVAETLRKFGLEAEAHTNKGINWLRQELAAGRPVIVWATYGFKDQPVKTFTPKDGDKVPIVQFEHTFLAVGYDANGITVIDPLDAQRKQFSYADFTRGWNLLDQMAVTVRLPGVARASDSPATTTTTVTASPPRWIPLVALLLLAVGVLGLRATQQPRRPQRMAHTMQVPMARPASSARPTPPRFQAPPLPRALPLPATVTTRLAAVERSARPRLASFARSSWARPLPLALAGIAVGLLVIAWAGAVSPCFTMPILALGGGGGVWAGLRLQALHHDEGHPAPR